jgi:hypothetical protein
MDYPRIIIDYIFVFVCFTMAISTLFILVRLGSRIYYDHKAARKHRDLKLKALREDAIASVMSVSTPKEPDKPKKPRPAKSSIGTAL